MYQAVKKCVGKQDILTNCGEFLPLMEKELSQGLMNMSLRGLSLFLMAIKLFRTFSMRIADNTQIRGRYLLIP